MQDERFILPDAMRPGWLAYPKSFCRLVEQGLINLTPWHLMEGERALRQAEGMAKRYPGRVLFPFAYRQDDDDVACWEMGHAERVFIVHDFASPGWEQREDYEDVWAWFRMAVGEMIDWE